VAFFSHHFSPYFNYHNIRLEAENKSTLVDSEQSVLRQIFERRTPQCEVHITTNYTTVCRLTVVLILTYLHNLNHYKNKTQRRPDSLRLPFSPLCFLRVMKYRINAVSGKTLFPVVLCPLSLVTVNPLNAELNPICHLLALLGVHHIFHVSGKHRTCLYRCFVRTTSHTVQYIKPPA